MTTTTSLTPAQKRAATLKYKTELQAQAAIEARDLKVAKDAAELSAFLEENEAVIAETTIVMTDALLAGANLIFSTVEFKDKWARAEARISSYEFGFYIEDRCIPSTVRLEATLGHDGFGRDTVPAATLNWSASGTQSVSNTHDFMAMLTQFTVLGSKLEEALAPVTPIITQDFRIVAEACNRTSAVVQPKIKAIMDDVRARIGG